MTSVLSLPVVGVARSCHACQRDQTLWSGHPAVSPPTSAISRGGNPMLARGGNAPGMCAP